MSLRDMEIAYIEAIYFTETGDLGQPGTHEDLTDLSKAHAHVACRDFRTAVGGVSGYGCVPNFDDLNWAQIGHDLWLTRNYHGTGFWDREEVYGKANAELFTRIALAMGPHDVEFEGV